MSRRAGLQRRLIPEPEKFGKRAAAAWARSTAQALIYDYMDAGQPWDTCRCEGCPKCTLKSEALKALARRINRRHS